ncbi:MAG TPA: TolC family protein [Candidatus Eisenbacteria bacterium]
MISRRPAGMAVFAIMLSALLIPGVAACADDETRPEVALDRPLSADEAVRLALDRNYRIAQATDLKGIQDANKLNAWGGFVPSLNLGYDFSRSGSKGSFQGDNLEISIPERTGQSDGFSLGASQTLFSLPVIFNIISAGKNSGAAGEEVRNAEQTAAQIVRTQYYNVIEAIKLEEVAREDVRLAGEELKRTQSLFDVGSVARTDVLKSNVRVSEAQSALTSAVNRIDVERALLNQALALPPTTVVQLIESLEPRADNPDSVQAYAQAVENRPDLVAARLRLEGARADQKAAIGGKIPYISHSFRASDITSDGDVQVTGEDNVPRFVSGNINSDSWSYQIGATWNILDGLVTESQIQRAKHNKHLQENQYHDLENTILVETTQALVALRNANAQIIVAREARVSAEEDLKLSQERYSVGLGTILELIDAQVNVSRARSGEVTAMAALKKAEAQLDKAVGRTNW